MALVTLDGQIGAGAPEVGRRIARMFDFTYVDRLLLPGHARASGAATRKNDPPPRFSDRVWFAVERAINGFALGNAAGDPYFAMSGPQFFPLTWDVSPSGPRVKAVELEAVDPAELAEMRLRTLAKRGKAVLVHRAGCLETRGAPDSLRIGLFAPWEDRVKRIMARKVSTGPPTPNESFGNASRHRSTTSGGSTGPTRMTSPCTTSASTPAASTSTRAQGV